ncbi:DUF47 domain-containing protein [Bacillus sp. FJAT-49736]|uniref:DUF47 domain-containing protein n=1 Tax=Bacillus sp. FJAT-49736 TaxID=2833582 RepID=UPI001BC94C26|nr:DUF47 domain-containing protein [Bacillus sp. FJAT-49736]MBS4172272.1 DUF47 domain-containing protein [Bacillus sp. FJAT-49736]
MPIIEKKDKFSLMLSNITANLEDSSKFLTETTIQNENDLKTLSTKMKEYETKGDTLIHEIIVELHKAFITPIDREDILQLAMRLDDVLDGLDHTASLMELYNITKPTVFMRDFVVELYGSCQEISKCIGLLAKKKLLDIRAHTIKIKDYESKCDDILRSSVKDLFATEKNPITIIQYKEVYENLELISDYCQDVANIFETIIMKNA